MPTSTLWFVQKTNYHFTEGSLQPAIRLEVHRHVVFRSKGTTYELRAGWECIRNKLAPDLLHSDISNKPIRQHRQGFQSQACVLVRKTDFDSEIALCNIFRALSVSETHSLTCQKRCIASNEHEI